MIYKEPPADAGAWMYFDSGKQAGNIREDPGQPLQTRIPEPVTQAMHQDGMDARIGRQHLEGIPGRRITLKGALDIFFDCFEHFFILQSVI
jgi:hypothetical protein